MGKSFIVGVLLAFAGLTGCQCGQVPDPTNVELGETALVVVLNPRINDLNSATVPAPGAQVSGVSVTLGTEDFVTGASGIAVFGGLDGGVTALEIGQGSLPLTLVEGELRELAVASSGSSLQPMADVRYDFNGTEVVELDAGMSITAVNAALNGSNRIVLVRGGTYQGDLVFNGSNVTLFGEGASGGRVTLDGNVEVNGSGNRIRGARITGDLLVDGSGFALTFSRVEGATTVTGSDNVLLHNRLCGTTAISGGNLTVLENAGLPPLPPDGGC
ncbi:MAG: hypothetical protein M3Y59_05690 [Myxococcota bacterium]|nr:hypothetical protein [Myxococcota bacterium]